MPSNVAVPYMNAWVMMLTLASRIGDPVALEVADQVVERPGRRGVVRRRLGVGLLGQHSRAPALRSARVYQWRFRPVRTTPLMRRRRRAPGRRGRTRRRRAGACRGARRERAIGMKMTADDRNAMPADAKATQRVLGDDPGARREDQRDDGRDRRLEDHRAGDVAHRQRVLALADPDDRVELLGQLGRDRGDDQGEQRGVDAERGREVLDGVDEEERADDDQAERGQDLEVDDPQPRARAGSSRWARTVEPVEAQRREVRGVDVGSASKWPLTYQA